MLYVLRSQKGQLKLAFENKPYQIGNVVRGTVAITAKKPIQARSLSVFLRCYSTASVCMSGGKKGSRQKIVDLPVHLMGADTIPQGASRTFSFEHTIPDAREHLDALLNASAELVPGPLKAFTAAAVKMQNHMLRFDWWLHAQLEADGIDLTDGKRLLVNDK